MVRVKQLSRPHQVHWRRNSTTQHEVTTPRRATTTALTRHTNASPLLFVATMREASRATATDRMATSPAGTLHHTHTPWTMQQRWTEYTYNSLEQRLAVRSLCKQEWVCWITVVATLLRTMCVCCRVDRLWLALPANRSCRHKPSQHTNTHIKYLLDSGVILLYWLVLDIHILFDILALYKKKHQKWKKKNLFASIPIHKP